MGPKRHKKIEMPTVSNARCPICADPLPWEKPVCRTCGFKGSKPAKQGGWSLENHLQQVTAIAEATAAERLATENTTHKVEDAFDQVQRTKQLLRLVGVTLAGALMVWLLWR